MHVHRETSEETDQRLCSILRKAELQVLPGLWQFDEFTADAFHRAARTDALALVRDEQSWSQLVPADASDAGEAMFVFSFHFAAGIDNSGFVGWLASRIKAEAGSGVAVVCGQNSDRGGIFDYWCCPLEAKNDVVALLHAMRTELQQ